MSIRLAVAATLSAAAAAAVAAPPTFRTIDESSEVLLDKTAAAAIWKENIPAERLARLYKPSQWGFASAVEGGFTPGGTCVVTARAMMLPMLRGTMKFPPTLRSTTFDAQPGLSKSQCSELAASKLKEAVQSVMSGLLK